MISEKMQTFLKIWRDDFGIERSIDEKICADCDGNPLPWYTYPLIEYLRQFDYRDKKIWEYGCGYSSLFWAQRAQKVTAVEDNPEWFAKWQKEFGTTENLEIRLRENEAYEKAIFEDGEHPDVIVIDGKRRSACAQAAVERLADGGMIILDDSDRVNTAKEYAAVINCLKDAGLLQVDFYGFCPLNCYPKTSSVFFCRNFNFETVAKVQPANGWGNLWSRPRRQRKEFYRKNSG